MCRVYLSKVSGTLPVVILVYQIRLEGKRDEVKKCIYFFGIEMTNLGHERTKASFLEGLPPGQKLGELLVPRVNLELQLAEWKWLLSSKITLHDRRECVKFPAFNINLKNIDVRVTCICANCKIHCQGGRGVNVSHEPFIFIRVSNLYILGESLGPC